MAKVIAAPAFSRGIRQLRKRFPHVLDDLQPLVSQLEAGEIPGDRIQGIKNYRVFKIRIANRDAQRGKRGGYRIIYYVQKAHLIYLVIIYSKSQVDDVPIDWLIAAIEEIEVEE